MNEIKMMKKIWKTGKRWRNISYYFGRFTKELVRYTPKGHVLSERAIKKVNNNIRSIIWEESIRRALVALRYNNGAVYFELPCGVKYNCNKTEHIWGKYESTRMYDRNTEPKANEMLWDEIMFKYYNYDDVLIQFLTKKNSNNEIIVSINNEYCCEFRGFRTSTVEELAARITDFMEAVCVFKLHWESKNFSKNKEDFEKLYIGRKHLCVRPYYYINYSVRLYRDPVSENLPANVEGYEFDKNALWKELQKYINVKETMYPSYQFNWSVTRKYDDYFNDGRISSEDYDKKTEFLSYVYTVIVNGSLIFFPKKKDLEKYLGYNKMPTYEYHYITRLYFENGISGFSSDGKSFDAEIFELKDLVIEINEKFEKDDCHFLNLFPKNLSPRHISDEELKSMYLQFSKVLHPDQASGNERLFRKMKKDYEECLEKRNSKSFREIYGRYM